MPWSACRWLRRNLGSVPFSDGYREVLGFRILLIVRPDFASVPMRYPVETFDRRLQGNKPISMCLFGLVVLRRVLGFCEDGISMQIRETQQSDSHIIILAIVGFLFFDVRLSLVLICQLVVLKDLCALIPLC